MPIKASDPQEVPFTAPDEIGVPTTTPKGELTQALNAIVEKFNLNGDAISALRVQKRNAFRHLPTEIRGTDGSFIFADGFAKDPSLLSSLNNEVVVSSDMRPHVFAEGADSWTKYVNYIYSPLSLKTQALYGSNTQIANPQSAQIGNVRLYTWTDVRPLNPADPDSHFYSVQAMFLDHNNAPIVLPFEVIGQSSPNMPKAKVCSDGTRFWLVYSVAGVLWVRTYDVNGVQLGSDVNICTMFFDQDPWDLIAGNSGSIPVLCHRKSTESSSVIVVTKFTFSGGPVVSTTNMSNVAFGSSGCAWAQVNIATNDAFLLTSGFDDGFHPVEYAWRITNLTTTPSVGFSFGTAGFVNGANTGISTGGLDGEVIQLTGVVEPDGFLHYQVSFTDKRGVGSTDRRQDRMLFLSCALASSAVFEDGKVYSVRAASRPFPLENGRQGIVVYMPSALTVSTLVPITPDSEARQYSGNPTYFIVDVDTLQVIGRFDDGQAGNEWTTLEYSTSNHPGWFCVATPFIGNDGLLRFTIGRNADSVNETIQQATTSDVIPFITVTRTISAVHIEMVTIGGLGQAIEYSGELFMPGLLASSFNGIFFSEQGINLAPEQPDVPAPSSSGSPSDALTLLGKYTWIAVFEWTASNGKRVRSSTSVPVQYTFTGANNIATLVGLFASMTNRPNLTVAIYRNIIVGGAPTAMLYKVTNDLNPVVNYRNATSGSVKWTFVDNVPDSVAITGEKLYTAQGFVERDPCPSFNCGCVFENRVFVAAPDNSIWFTAEDAEGDPLWFSADGLKFPMPTSDPIMQLIGMDGRLFILCANSIWYTTGGRWPGPDGLNGGIETPRFLSLTEGCTGFARAIKEGILYSSNVGGTWLITRSLTRVPYSRGAQDHFKDPSTLAINSINGITIDKDQRIDVSVAGSAHQKMILDQESKVWSEWIMPTAILLSHSFKGKFIYADSTEVLKQTDGSYMDAMHSGGVTVQSWYTMRIQATYGSLFSIKGLKRIWRFLVSGAQRATHRFFLLATYGTEDTDITESWDFEPDITARFENDFQPKIEEMESLTLRFSDSPSTITTFDTGDSFALDLVSFEIGTDGALTKTPPSTRRRQST